MSAPKPELVAYVKKYLGTVPEEAIRKKLQDAGHGSDSIEAALLEAKGGPKERAGDRTPRILVVDDDLTMRELVSQALKSKGFRVTQADDAMQEVIQAEGMELDLVVSDIRMPNFGSGVDAYNELRQSPFLQKELPVIFVTGIPLAEALAMLPKGDKYVRLLPKPIDLERLHELIAEMLALGAGA